MTRLLSGIVALMLATPLVQQISRDVARVQQEEARRDGEWLDQFLAPAYDAWMPLDVAALRAAYRREDSNRQGEIEQYFAISLAEAGSDRLTATVVVPVDDAITRQLLSLLHRDFRASFESILVQVSVRRYVLDSATCPAIRSRMNVLSKLNLSVRDDNLLFIHPTWHRVAVWFSVGRIDATMYDEKHPLVQWAAETYTALIACGRTRQ